MTSLLFKKDQNELFRKQRQDNKEEIYSWDFVNLFIPVLIIFIPTMLCSFLPPEKVTFQNLVLNGSFSLLGINVLFTTSLFLVNSLRIQDQKIERQIYYLRLRLIIYLCGLLVFGSLFYFVQIGYDIDSNSRMATVLIGCMLLLYLSVGIGKRIYLIKDELVGKSFSDDVKDTVKDLKNSVDDLD